MSVTETSPSQDRPGMSLVLVDLGPTRRSKLRMALFAQILQAWEFADLAGMRRSNWSYQENRELILRQRIEALSDGELCAMSRTEMTDREPVDEDFMQRAAVNAQIESYTSTRVQLHVPGYLLLAPAEATPGR